MIHLQADLINQALRNHKENPSQCCLDAASSAWVKVFFDPEHVDFFISLIERSVKDAESPGDVMARILSLGLVIGSVCALGVFEVMKQDLESKLLFIQKGPREQV